LILIPMIGLTLNYTPLGIKSFTVLTLLLILASIFMAATVRGLKSRVGGESSPYENIWVDIR
jgi:uncharacterized membrane protein